MTDVFVDFGDTADDHLISTRDIDGLVVDQVVTLSDEEGNSCSGTVTRIDSSRAWVLPDWGTWHPAEPPAVGYILWVDGLSVPVTGACIPVESIDPWVGVEWGAVPQKTTETAFDPVSV